MLTYEPDLDPEDWETSRKLAHHMLDDMFDRPIREVGAEGRRAHGCAIAERAHSATKIRRMGTAQRREGFLLSKRWGKRILRV